MFIDFISKVNMKNSISNKRNTSGISGLILDKAEHELIETIYQQPIDLGVENKQTELRGWGCSEFEAVDFGDSRLNARLMKITNHMIESPECSINHACGNWPETKAAYRFFQNEKVSSAEVLSAHVTKAVERVKQYKTILAIQDTCYVSYTTHHKTTGLGILTSRMGDHHKIEGNGLIMHTTLAVTTEGLPLGMLDQQIYSREPVTEEVKELKKKSHGNGVAIEDKESIRWLESLAESNKHFKVEDDIRVVTVCDREGDIYEFFEKAQRIEVPVLVRASQDRVINRTSLYSKQKSPKLWDFIENLPCQGTIEVKIPASNNKPSRNAKLEIRYGEFTMNIPRNHYKSKKKNLDKENFSIDLKVTAVHAAEKDPTSGEEGLEWMLITNLPVSNFEEAVEKVKWYCLRWKIEVFHKILKSGFVVEECRLSTADRLIRYLAVMSVIACRIFFMTLLGRTNPELPCTFLLSEDEWKVLYSKQHKTKLYPDEPPTVKEVIKWIAQLGGFLGRKNDGNPGPITFWRGLRRLSDLVEGWCLSG